MKRSGLLFAVVLFLIQCKSPEKLLQKGDYDALIDKVIKKELKGKADNSDRELLDKAYHLANDRDQGRINFLLQEDKAENWDEIYRRYSTLSFRQDKLKKVVPFNIGSKRISYNFIDYTDKIVEAKTEAAKYFYNRAESNMRYNTKEGYRMAYADYLKARNYREEDFPGINFKIDDARRRGMSHVLIEMDSRIPFRMPGDFYIELDNINLTELNSSWVEYHQVLNQDIIYDYYITIILNDVDVTPPIEETEEYRRQKKVRDGFEYELDGSGNVKKDSLGNDIKVPKYKYLRARVLKTRQYKAVTIKGEVEFVSANPERLLGQEPVAATSVFEHISGKASGNREVLEPEDLKLINIDEQAYPSDGDMIMDCAPILRNAIQDAIHDNRHLIY